MKQITVDELLALPREQFIERCKLWNTEFGMMEIEDPLHCPLHFWVVHNHAKCSKEMVANTASCPVCGHPCCPDCMNHMVDQLSRVTGYMAPVSGWGAAKKQEFKDRKRFEINR